MKFPGPDDWCFHEIRERERDRAEALEAGMEPSVLIDQLSISMCAAINDGRARYGLDHKDRCPRITVQIPVAPELYDRFHNGRRGYRAHYWVAPNDGNDFDNKLVCLLRQAIGAHMPSSVEGRQVDVKIEHGERSDRDVGACQISRDFAVQSLVPEASKVWICERLITSACGPLPWQLPVTGPRLIIEKWKACTAGLLAPCGEWLDFKGGFVDHNGRAKPAKDRNHRAAQIHETGWT